MSSPTTASGPRIGSATPERLGLYLTAQAALAGASLVLLASQWHSADGANLWMRTVAFSASVTWCFWSWRAVTGRLGDSYALFLLSFVLFSGGQLPLFALGLLPNGLLEGRFSGATSERTVLLTNASLAFLHLGAIACVGRPRSAARGIRRPLDELVLRRIGLAFLAIGVPAWAYSTYETARFVAASGYMALYLRELRVGAANWDGALTVFLMPGLLLLIGTAPQRRLVVRLAWGMALLRVATALFIGNRGAAAMSLVPMLLVHHRLVRPVSHRVLITVALVGLLAMPLVKELRNLGAKERLSVLSEGFEVIRITSVIEEMGQSMRPTAHIIELVPDARSYDYGRGFLLAASTAFPNLFWEQHPAVAAGTYAAWLVRKVEPAFADIGGGIGFSMIAEGYVNFGRFGTIVFCCVVGYLIAAMVTQRNRDSQRGVVVLEAVVLSALLFYPRGEANGAVRTIVWCAMIPYAISARRWRAHRSRSEPPSTSAVTSQ